MSRQRATYAASTTSALVMVVVACTPRLSGVTDGNGYTDIALEQPSGMREDKDFTLVNVHIPYEGEIPQTDLFIPGDQIAEHTAELPDKDAPKVLYCRSGSMSTTAAETLMALGYTNLKELDDGTRAWEAAGDDLPYRRTSLWPGGQGMGSMGVTCLSWPGRSCWAGFRSEISKRRRPTLEKRRTGIWMITSTRWMRQHGDPFRWRRSATAV